MITLERNDKRQWADAYIELDQKVAAAMNVALKAGVPYSAVAGALWTYLAWIMAGPVAGWAPPRELVAGQEACGGYKPKTNTWKPQSEPESAQGVQP